MKRISLWVMVAFYTAAGINHFVHPVMYLSIMPPWLPLQKELVIISGVLEILCALLLIFGATRRLAAWALIVLLVAIFPANIQMMLNYKHEHNPLLWVAIARLPLQILLVWWAYTFAHVKMQAQRF